jgi:hypothetical protein
LITMHGHVVRHFLSGYMTMPVVTSFYAHMFLADNLLNSMLINSHKLTLTSCKH